VKCNPLKRKGEHSWSEAEPPVKRFCLGLRSRNSRRS
jgi:hypothetical protein